MSRSPLVSFLMPVKAPAPFLSQALAGIVSQTVQDWELVLAADGWDEAVVRTAREMVPEHKLKIVEVVGGSGIVYALNQGLVHCNGEWVARVDADDVSHMQRLERQLVAAERYPSVVVWGTWARVVDESGAKLGALGVAGGRDVRTRLLWRNVLTHSSVLMRRNEVQSAGAYNALVSQAEDYELWLRLGAAFPIGVVEDELVDYRISDHQVSKKTVPLRARHFVHASRWAMGMSLGVSRARLGAARVFYETKRIPSIRSRVGGLSSWR